MDLAELMMHYDITNVLPDDLLVKVDRASMAVGLESREPLLDYRLFEFASCLPVEHKIGPTGGKRILKDILYRYVPRNIIDRPKQGFAVPLQRWLREDLRECVEETLFSEDRANELFNMKELRRVWAVHQAGRWDLKGVLWRAFVLKRWLAANRWS